MFFISFFNVSCVLELVFVGVIKDVRETRNLMGSLNEKYPMESLGLNHLKRVKSSKITKGLLT